MKKFICFFSILLLISCDSLHFFNFNNKGIHIISDECGSVRIVGGAINKSKIILVFNFESQYVVNIDSLKITPVDFDFNIKYGFLYFELNKEEIKEKKIDVKSGDCLKILFVAGSSEFFILPSNFIKCDDKPAIIDTIKIEYQK